jgi:uncharacterized membrane protein YkoI
LPVLFSKIILAAMVAVITLVGAGAAFAGSREKETDEQDELSVVTNAKTSLSQAIAAAEQETGGKAVETGIENHDGVFIAYEVRIAKGNTLQKVFVDLDTGKVIKVAPSDCDDQEDEDSDHEDD